MDAETAGPAIHAFHRGRFHVAQPVKGHRSGMDAMMLAAALPSHFNGKVADLGAGSGAAGLAVVSRCTGAQALLVEREPEMLHHAHQTLALAENAGIADRAEIIAADVSLNGRARAAAGLADNSVDFAIMNPPFNDPGDRQTNEPLRRTAHVMEEGLLAAWTRTAAAMVRPRGGFALIARPTSLAESLAALDGRFGGAEIMLIHPRPGSAAIRFVVRAVRGSRARLSFVAPLFLHEAEGNSFSSRAESTLNGEISLFDD